MPPQSVQDPGNELSALLQEWIDSEMHEHPTRATALGVDGLDHLLGDFSPGSFEARAGAARRWHARFSALPDEGLDPGSLIDRDLVLSHLRGRMLMEDWQLWRRDPSVYLDPCLSGIFILFLHRQRPMPELAAAAAARLSQVPAALDAAVSALDPGLLSPVIRDRALGQCAAAARFFRVLLPAEVPEGEGRAQVAAAGGPAADAFEHLGAHLADMEPTGDFAIGEELYSALLRQRELLDYGASGLHQRGLEAWSDLDRRMTEAAGRLGHNRWREAMEELNRRHPATPEDMLLAYQAATQRCRRFLVEHALVSLPEDESCAVVPSPTYQRPVLAVASYTAPPAFKPSRHGHFFVPFPPDGTDPEQVRQRLATNSFASMATISAHEAYPGHHWHLVWSQDHASPVRSVVRTPYFSEGWALFAEHLMGEAGFFADEAERLAHLDARIFRAARIVVDTSLHCGQMTFDQAVDHMHTHTGLSEATARAEVVRYCAWPTQAASYLTGALELERLRERYLSAGLGDARSFNDTVAGSGSLPLGLAARAVLGSAAA